MTTAWKWTMDPDNITGVDARGNFIPDTGLMILVRVPAWVEPILPGFLESEINASTTIRNRCCESLINLLESLI
jgi:hypothetical protein